MKDIWYVYLERAGWSWRTALPRDQSSGQYPAWPNPSPGQPSLNSDAQLSLLVTSWFGFSFSEGKGVLGLCLALPNPGKGHIGLLGAWSHTIRGGQWGGPHCFAISVLPWYLPLLKWKIPGILGGKWPLLGPQCRLPLPWGPPPPPHVPFPLVSRLGRECVNFLMLISQLLWSWFGDENLVFWYWRSPSGPAPWDRGGHSGSVSVLHLFSICGAGLLCQWLLVLLYSKETSTCQQGALS